MKSILTLALVLLLAPFALAAEEEAATPVAAAQEVQAETPTLFLEEEGDCAEPDPFAALANPDADPSLQSGWNSCGSCSTSGCKNVPRGNPCYVGSGQGWGNCDIYLGNLCPGETAFRCICYGQGGQIP